MGMKFNQPGSDFAYLAGDFAGESFAVFTLIMWMKNMGVGSGNDRLFDTGIGNVLMAYREGSSDVCSAALDSNIGRPLGDMPLNAWSMGAIVSDWDGVGLFGSYKQYRDGVLTDSGLTIGQTRPLNVFAFGNYNQYLVPNVNSWIGGIAAYAVYNIAMTLPPITQLLTQPPDQVLPGNLLHYWRMFDQNDIFDRGIGTPRNLSKVITGAGSYTDIDHPYAVGPSGFFSRQQYDRRLRFAR